MPTWGQLGLFWRRPGRCSSGTLNSGLAAGAELDKIKLDRLAARQEALACRSSGQLPMQLADDWLGPPGSLNAITSATRALEVLGTIRASSITLPHDRKHWLVEVVEALDSCQCDLRTMSSDRRALVIFKKNLAY